MTSKLPNLGCFICIEILIFYVNWSDGNSIDGTLVCKYNIDIEFRYWYYIIVI